MNTEIPEKALLDACADEVLAAMAEARGQGGEYGAAVRPLARDLAGVLRAQFPGRDAENARVLATALAELAGLGLAMEESGTAPDESAPVLLDVLCCAVDELNQGDGPRPEGTGR